MATVLLSAAEPSADAMGAALLTELKARLPSDTAFIGCGGDAMAAAGFPTAFDTGALAVMGLGDAARAIPAALRGARQLGRLANAQRADVAVLIDGWGFSKLAADRIARDAPKTALVKLATPQVWASRPKRAQLVRDRFDLVLTLLPFEPALFEGPTTRAVFVGNPNFETASATERSGPAFRARHDLGDAPILVVLPGSRQGEISRLMPVFGEAARRAGEHRPGLRTVIVAAPSVAQVVRRAATEWDTAPLIVGSTERFDAFGAANAALAASGTVTTELAICGVPMVVGYKTGPLTAAWARRAIITPFVSIINVAAGRAVIPEHIQEHCTPERLSADLVSLLTDEAASCAQRDAQDRVLPTLLGSGAAGGAAARAAHEIADLIGQRENPSDLDASAKG